MIFQNNQPNTLQKEEESYKSTIESLKVELSEIKLQRDEEISKLQVENKDRSDKMSDIQTQIDDLSQLKVIYCLFIIKGCMHLSLMIFLNPNNVLKTYLKTN